MTREFGPEVARIVEEVTEDKNPDDSMATNRATWEKRKTNYLIHLKNDSFEGLMVCCADKIHNLQSMLEAHRDLGDAIWSRFNAPKHQLIWFHKEVMATLRASLRNDILTEYERVYALSIKDFEIK
jgi:(p)ppGpp synthase/HD superfamily hydrolase